MGSAKEWWFDNRDTHSLHFECPKCQFGCASYFHAPEPYEIVEEGDYHEEAVECLRCRSRWVAIVTADPETDEYQAEIAEHPETAVQIHEVDYSNDRDEWDDYQELEAKAFDIFQEALKEWWQLLDKIGDPNGGSSSSNRMLFTQLFSLLEAYLFSEIVDIAERDAGVQRGILKAMPALGEQPIKLSTIADSPTLVTDKVKAALSDLSFHNFAVVESLCREGLQNGMLPTQKDERDLLMKAVATRHDCVHRNGFTKEGKVVEDVTMARMMEVAKALERMARRVQQRVADIDGHRLAKLHFATVKLGDKEQ